MVFLIDLSENVFLLYKGKLVAQKGINQNNKKLFLSLPGGGIDKGEAPKKGY